MLFTLVTWLSCTFTQSFTLQHLKALCVTIVSRFFPPLCKWGEQEWQGQPWAVVGPGSWMWLLSDLAGRQKHHQVRVVQLAFVTSTMQRATDGGGTPFPCFLWNLIQPCPLGAPQSNAFPYFRHSVFGVCVEYALRQQVKHGLLSTMCSLTSPVSWQETLSHSCKYPPHKQYMCLVRASFYFSYYSVMSNILLIFTVFFWC